LQPSSRQGDAARQVASNDTRTNKEEENNNDTISRRSKPRLAHLLKGNAVQHFAAKTTST